MNEKNYVRYRKLKAYGNRLLFYCCRIFPINNNLISVCTFEGKGGFGCNPKYIVQELHRRNEKYQFVWFVNDMSKEFPEYIKKVPNTFWSRAYWLSRSKVWIDNYRKPYGTTKRQGQFYLNTWHGSVGFKSIGLWRGQKFSRMAYLVSKNDSEMIDCICSDSRWCDEVFPKGLIYQGVFERTGYPRCDILTGQTLHFRNQFRDRYHLDRNTKIVMYAPTFRERNIRGKRSVAKATMELNVEGILKQISKKFGGDWIWINRFHPQVVEEDSQKEFLSSDRNIDVSLEPDMYEILAAIDLLITDFSSVAFEAMYAEIPVFMYATDISEYMANRGGQQWMFKEDTSLPVHNNRDMMPGMNLVIPFSISKNENELKTHIEEFDKVLYCKKINEFKKALELVFDGKASERVSDLIEDVMNVT